MNDRILERGKLDISHLVVHWCPTMTTKELGRLAQNVAQMKVYRQILQAKSGKMVLVVSIAFKRMLIIANNSS